VQPGNSGGPLVDSAGSVVGIVAGQLDKIATLKATGNLPENVNYAVKSSLLLALLESVPKIQDKLETPQDVGGDDRATVGQRVAKAICLVIVDQ
jgi:S1-C subfamily serine protease